MLKYFQTLHTVMGLWSWVHHAISWIALKQNWDFFLQYCDLPPLITVEDRRVSQSLGFQITKIVEIFEKKKQKTFITDCMCWISIRPTTNMTNHDNTATFCEIKNSVKILLGLVSHRVSTVNGFWWNIVCSNCSSLCCGWILDYINLCEKKYGNTSKVYFNVLFGSEYIVNGYHVWKWQFF